MPFDPTEIAVWTKDGHHFRLINPFIYTTKAGEVIIVPAGTETDGASTPQIGWTTLPPFGRYWLAAFLHDYLYRDTRRPKSDCDHILLEAMESLGVPELERDVIYEGVHLGGWKAFEEDRKMEVPHET